MRAERVTDRVTYHGEGAVWSSAWGGLRFVDMHAGDLMSLAAAGTVTREHLGELAACVRPRVGGGMVAAVKRGFMLEDPDGTRHTLPELWSDTGIRMNEGGCDPAGSFYCGSMSYSLEPGAGSVYRLSPGGKVDVALTGVTIPNGFAFSPDHLTAYHAETTTGEVRAYNWSVEDGLTNGRPFARIPDDAGAPDGLTVDSEGGLWVALWQGGAVWHFDSAGRHDETVEVGASQVTSCALGGDGLDELWITTSWEGMDEDAEPVAGSLFRAQVGVKGLEPLPYAG
ncbi:sugar lactone lactonase YvrE [Motilibacter peucedani]|uniref:Sugar lactone lactonase YvrE n=1 Tax=Motilibacter peucedani TaxID=598650 RepID=A0A420XRP8_9ACTN|nr:SMP-30/gluconolactonase/LRE family protein [Motilibacter peucedani]RKS77481.1 sugar lactone lactonase YvrE [Motilibacter peucedani]